MKQGKSNTIFLPIVLLIGIIIGSICGIKALTPSLLKGREKAADSVNPSFDVFGIEAEEISNSEDLRYWATLHSSLKLRRHGDYMGTWKLQRYVVVGELNKDEILKIEAFKKRFGETIISHDPGYRSQKSAIDIRTPENP